jgi:hypothetical protein
MSGEPEASQRRLAAIPSMDAGHAEWLERELASC